MSQPAEQTGSTRDGFASRLGSLVPGIGWLRSYNRQRDLGADLLAGLIITVMLIPQSMAIALLAGLPASSGLYAATVPALIYGLFGTSRHLNVGPVAIVSLLTFAGISQLATPGTDEYISMALLLMLMVGVIHLGLGLVQAGFIVRFFSHAVISGFVSASAIIIAVSQLGNLLGFDLDAEGTAWEITANTISSLDDVHPTTAAIGIASVLLLVGYRLLVPRLPAHLLLIASRFPAALLLTVGGTLLVWLLALDADGVSVVGDVPAGLPSPAAPDIHASALRTLLPIALTITFVGYVESISIARTIAARERERINANQELYALGLANIAGSFFAGYPVSGSFSRTAVSYQGGGRTQLAGMIAAAAIILTLIFLTPLLYYLPNAVLAAIIIVSVFGLVNIREPRHYLTIRRLDGLTLLVTFLSTLLLGVEYGILVGLAFSLIVFLWRSTDPHAVEIGYNEVEGSFRSIQRFPEARLFERTLIFRIDAPLYFANIEELEQRIERAVARRPEIAWIVIDCSGVADIDAVAVDKLDYLMRSYQAAGIKMLLAGVRGHVRDVLVRAGWGNERADHLRYPTVRLALEYLGLMSRFEGAPGGLHAGLFGGRPGEDILPGVEPEVVSSVVQDRE